MSFEAQEEKVFELFNRKVYSIPRNQRRYVWNKDNWKELYDDVMAVVKGNLSSHFIGSVVLRKDPVENGLPCYSVIDGQQRTITLSIFLGSIMFWMKKLSMEDDYNGTKPYIIAKNDKNKDVLMVTAESSGSLESMAVTDDDNDRIIVKHPTDININEAVQMELCINKKAAEVNRLFGNREWHARDIDMILWSYGRQQKD